MQHQLPFLEFVPVNRLIIHLAAVVSCKGLSHRVCSQVEDPVDSYLTAARLDRTDAREIVRLKAIYPMLRPGDLPTIQDRGYYAAGWERLSSAKRDYPYHHLNACPAP